jgi:hypothetical protein
MVQVAVLAKVNVLRDLVDSTEVEHREEDVRFM